MGDTRMGPPTRLVLALRDELRLRNFVETGTYLGTTTRWASEHFESVQSIEVAEAIYRETAPRLADIPNVRLHLGDTREHLPRIMGSLESRALVFMDAHWSGGATYGAADECPLLEELQVVNGSPLDHCILIDDARLFLAPPPQPHDSEQWPGIAEVLQVLTAARNRYVVVFEDVIIATPESARSVVVEYCRTRQERAVSSSALFRDAVRTLRRSLRTLLKPS